MAIQSVTLSTGAWSQEQKNLIHAASAALLATAAITHGGIIVSGGNTVQVTDPSASITSALTTVTVQARIQQILDDAATAKALADVEMAKRTTFLNSSDLREINIDAVVDKINSISNLNEMKQFMIRLVKHLVARGVV